MKTPEKQPPDGLIPCDLRRQMSVFDMYTKGRLMSQVGMAGLVATCGRCLLLLLVLCTPDATTLSLPFHTHHLLPAGPHPGGGHTLNSHPPEADLLPRSSASISSSSTRLALTRLALVVQHLHQGERQYLGGGPWRDNDTEVHTNKNKRQGFFGIDNADFVLRTLQLKNTATKSDRNVVDATTDDSLVARVALVKAVRMRNRHRQRQRVRPSPGNPRPSSPIRMSVDTSIQDLRRLMEKQGR